MRTMNEQNLAIYEAETRAYQTAMDIIERSMSPEPYLEDDKTSKKYRKWAKKTQAMRAVKCDILEKYMQAEGMRAHYKKLVEEDERKEEERKAKIEKDKNND